MFVPTPGLGGGGYSDMKLVYICAAQGLKMGGLGSGPSLKMVGGGGFQSGHSLENRGFWS